MQRLTCITCQTAEDLVGMQVFYYLRSLDDALTHALGAGSLFDITEQSEYVKTIVGMFCVFLVDL